MLIIEKYLQLHSHFEKIRVLLVEIHTKSYSNYNGGHVVENTSKSKLLTKF